MKHLLCVIAILLISHQSNGLQKILYESKDVTIQTGLHECIADCSMESLSCRVEECSYPEISSSFAQGPYIEDVHLERFTDPDANEVKLALYVKWKSKISGGIENTTGFLVDISNGEKTYKKCYSFSTPLTMDNIEDEFYNDCFGKIKGTSIKIGSTVTVNITSLPFAHNNPEQGRSVVVVNIPSCSASGLEDLKACQKKGIQTSSSQCVTNCNTFSVVNNATYPIECSISDKVWGFGPEKCPEKSRTTSGTPSHPKHINKEREWYTFLDPSGEVKVALNFSWWPRDDSSITALPGYLIEVTPKGKSSLINFNKCFTIGTELTEAKHKNAEFFYDCYGRESTDEVTPNDAFTVIIKSRGGNADRDDFLRFDIKLPGCGDPLMESVSYCKKLNQRYLEGKIDRIVCENRTIVYSYRVSPEYGNRAEVGFCKKGIYTSCSETIYFMKNLEPSGTLYNLSLLSSANLTMNYSIFVNGNKRRVTRRTIVTTLSECVREELISIIAIVSISSAVLIFLLIVIFFVWFNFYRRKYTCGKLRRLQDVYWSPLEKYPDVYKSPMKVPGVVKVYVAFSEDHARHKDVIYWFCAFLKHDLGVDVHSIIWDENEASVNCRRYIMKSIRDADKVVIICSPGGKDCLQSKNSEDYFSPVVDQACQNLVAGKNVGKYMVAYFGYSKRQDVPRLLLEQIQLRSKVYNLMKQFEEFYFHLVDVEQYQPGGILRIKEIQRYADPKRSSCGEKLHAALESLSTYARTNPSWHIRSNKNEATEPFNSPPDTAHNALSSVWQENPNQNTSIPHHIHGESYDNHLHVTATSAAVVQNGTGCMHPHAKQQVDNAHSQFITTLANQRDAFAQDRPNIQYQEARNAGCSSSERLSQGYLEEICIPQECGSDVDGTKNSFKIPESYNRSSSLSKAVVKPQMKQNGTANPVSSHFISDQSDNLSVSSSDNLIVDRKLMNGFSSNETEVTMVELQSLEVQM